LYSKLSAFFQTKGIFIFILFLFLDKNIVFQAQETFIIFHKILSVFYWSLYIFCYVSSILTRSLLLILILFNVLMSFSALYWWKFIIGSTFRHFIAKFCLKMFKWNTHNVSMGFDCKIKLLIYILNVVESTYRKMFQFFIQKTRLHADSVSNDFPSFFFIYIFYEIHSEK
jgi:hypothetical protein